MADLVNFKKMNRAWYDGREISKIFAGGQVWEKSKFSDLYGTGAGQIQVHLMPSRSGKRNAPVTHIRNLGGGGTAYDAQAYNTTFYDGSGDNSISTADAAYLVLNTPIDAVGKRVFFPCYRTATIQPYVFGSSLGELSENTSFRFVHSNTADTRLTVYNTTANFTIGGNIPRGINAWHLVEFEATSSGCRLWHDGVESDAVTAGRVAPAMIQNISAGSVYVSATPRWSGRIGDIIIMDASINIDASVARIRNELARKYNITLGI